MNGIWATDFQLTFSVSDDTGGSGAGEQVVSGPSDKVSIGAVGLAPDDTNIVGTEYGVRVTLLDTRTTTAGEEITLTITPMDKAGNSGTAATHKVKLAANMPTATAATVTAAPSECFNCC